MTRRRTGRRRARGYALQVLYAVDANPDTSVDGLFAAMWATLERESDRSVRRFAERLVRLVLEHLDDIDATLQGVSKNWRLDRMSRVDRNILRLATCELGYTLKVPRPVIINEAIELAKRFGAEESAAFVNGILDRIARVRRQ